MVFQKQPQNICERTFNFAIRIIKLCQVLEQKSGGIEKTLSKQLLRSGTSIGANAEETQAAQSKQDFVHKNAIALKEARETIYWLKLLAATEIISQDKLANIQQEAGEIQRIIASIIIKTKKQTKYFFSF